MKFKRIDEETEMAEAPKVYVSTYGKYGDGSLNGQWVTLTDFNDYAEFREHLHELHSDEEDPEFMFQDHEGFPDVWYDEGGLSEETFNKIMEWYDLDPKTQEAYEDFLDWQGEDATLEDFYEAYHGNYGPGASASDIGYDLVQDMGLPAHPDYYFDFERFGSDAMDDWHEGDEDNEDVDGEPEDPDWWYDSEGVRQCETSLSTAEIGEYLVNDIYGGVEHMDKQMVERYFDYDQFGSDVLIDDMYLTRKGNLFWNN